MSERRERLLNIIHLLADGQRWSCTQLAYKFSVSRQTINKDIMELSITYPIVTYMGKSGGVECLSVPKTITTLLDIEDGMLLIKCLEENYEKQPNLKVGILIEKARKIFEIEK